MIRNQFIRDRTGEGYVDVAIAILLIFTVIAGIFSLFPIYTTYRPATFRIPIRSGWRR